jgi:hypothetical protein
VVPRPRNRTTSRSAHGTKGSFYFRLCGLIDRATAKESITFGVADILGVSLDRHQAGAPSRATQAPQGCRGRPSEGDRYGRRRH